MNHRSCVPFDVSSALSQPPVDEDKRTLTSAALGHITPSPMDDDIPLLDSSIDRELDDINDLRFVDGLSVTETIPMPSLDHIETEKLSLEKLPLDEEMEVVVKSDDLMTPTPGLFESPVPTSGVQNQWGMTFIEPKEASVHAASFSSIRPIPLIPPSKQSGKRKLANKLKVNVGLNWKGEHRKLGWSKQDLMQLDLRVPKCKQALRNPIYNLANFRQPSLV